MDGKLHDGFRGGQFDLDVSRGGHVRVVKSHELRRHSALRWQLVILGCNPLARRGVDVRQGRDRHVPAVEFQPVDPTRPVAGEMIDRHAVAAGCCRVVGRLAARSGRTGPGKRDCEGKKSQSGECDASSWRSPRSGTGSASVVLRQALAKPVAPRINRPPAAAASPATSSVVFIEQNFGPHMLQ